MVSRQAHNLKTPVRIRVPQHDLKHTLEACVLGYPFLTVSLAVIPINRPSFLGMLYPLTLHSKTFSTPKPFVISSLISGLISFTNNREIPSPPLIIVPALVSLTLVPTNSRASPFFLKLNERIPSGASVFLRVQIASSDHSY